MIAGFIYDVESGEVERRRPLGAARVTGWCEQPQPEQHFWW